MSDCYFCFELNADDINRSYQSETPASRFHNAKDNVMAMSNIRGIQERGGFFEYSKGNVTALKVKKPEIGFDQYFLVVKVTDFKGREQAICKDILETMEISAAQPIIRAYKVESESRPELINLSAKTTLGEQQKGSAIAASCLRSWTSTFKHPFGSHSDSSVEARGEKETERETRLSAKKYSS